MSCRLPSIPERGGLPSDIIQLTAVAAWKHRFSSQCLSVVQDQAFGARTPSYRTIQELDKLVRAFYVPPSLQVPGFGGAKIGVEVEQPTTELTMQRYTAFSLKEISMCISSYPS
jgi:hypothetical protein